MTNNNVNNTITIIKDKPIYNYQRTVNNLNKDILLSLTNNMHGTIGVHLLNGPNPNEPVPKLKKEQAFVIKQAYMKDMIIYADIHVLNNEKGIAFLHDYENNNIGFDVKILIFGGKQIPLYCLSSLSNKFN